MHTACDLEEAIAQEFLPVFTSREVIDDIWGLLALPKLKKKKEAEYINLKLPQHTKRNIDMAWLKGTSSWLNVMNSLKGTWFCTTYIGVTFEMPYAYNTTGLHLACHLSVLVGGASQLVMQWIVQVGVSK